VGTVVFFVLNKLLSQKRTFRVSVSCRVCRVIHVQGAAGEFSACLRWALGRGDVRCDCRSTQCCVAVWSRWLESATRRVGFRALKKTLEELYTTKVNHR
jgi:hypothetical protein